MNIHSLLSIATSLTLCAAAAAQETVTITPSQDSWVGRDAPDTAHGQGTTCGLRGSAAWSDAKEAFLRFEVPEIDGIVSADLSLYLQNLNVANTIEIASVVTSDDVEAMTWNTRPTSASVISTGAASTADGRVEYDASAGIVPGSSIVLRVRLDGNGWGWFRSREHASGEAPELRIHTHGGLRLPASKDTSVHRDTPDTVHSASAHLALRGNENWSDAKEAYLEFEVPQVSAIAYVGLELYQYNFNVSNVLELGTVATTADVDQLTWNTRPSQSSFTPYSMTPLLAQTGMMELEVTGAITSGSTVVLRLRLTGNGWGNFRSQEHGTGPGPVLVIRTADPGSIFCPGDGSVAPCPCGNDSAPGAGEGCVTSAGGGGRLRIAPGSGRSVSAEDLVLLADGLPAGNGGIFVAGTGTVAAIGVYDGLFCIGGSTMRLNAGFETGPGQRLSGAAGAGSLIGEANSIQAGFFAPSARYYFLYWFRDVATGASPCSTFANFTNGYSLMLIP